MPVVFDPIPEAPRRAAAERRQGASVAAAGAGARWSLPGRRGEFLLDPREPGPLLVPVPEHGASLATALVEALDRAAAAGRDVIEVRRGAAALTLERAGGWPAPPLPPSEVLAGRSAPGTRAFAFSGGELIETARERIGAEGVAALCAYPRRRVELEAARRRAERAFFRVDEELRGGRRGGAALAAGCAVSLAAAGAGALFDAGGLAASAALLFAAGAGLLTRRGWRRAGLHAERDAQRAEVAAAVREEEGLDDEARTLARRVGEEDPHALADRLAALQAEEARASSSEAELEYLREVARRLAARLDVAGPELEDTGRWRTPHTPQTTSWPPDVALVEERGGPAAALVGMARLLVRIERDLPAPWPLVLWEPWTGASPEVRARRLMALADALPGRRVVAFVRA